MAAQIGQQEIVTLLLAHGANPTLTTKVNTLSESSLMTIYLDIYKFALGLSAVTLLVEHEGCTVGYGF